MVQVAERNENYFGKNDHGVEVTIVGGVIEESKSGSQYIQFAFEHDGKEGDTGYNNYITEKALPFTAQRVQAILSHNAPNEEAKEKARKALIDLPDAQFGEWSIKALTGKKAFLVISFSESINPKNGKPYLEKNLQGYAPKPLEEAAMTADSLLGGAKPVSKEESDNIPF